MAQDTWYVYLTDDIKIFIYIAFFGNFSPFEDISTFRKFESTTIVAVFMSLARGT